jgi:dCTP deaminase
MIKNDKWIKEKAKQGMIIPFEPQLIRTIEIQAGILDAPDSQISKWKKPVISYGLSSYGYDIRLSPKDFRIFRHIPGHVVDPKNFNPSNLQPADMDYDEHGDFFILPAHSYGLGVALEYIKMPDNVTVICIGKSTYARCGIIANITPIEAQWEGHLTLEFSNSSSADCRIYANEGVVQLLFFEGEPCETTYAARSGKYQGQPEQVITARV